MDPGRHRHATLRPVTPFSTDPAPWLNTCALSADSLHTAAKRMLQQVVAGYADSILGRDAGGPHGSSRWAVSACGRWCVVRRGPTRQGRYPHHAARSLRPQLSFHPPVCLGDLRRWPGPIRSRRFSAEQSTRSALRRSPCHTAHGSHTAHGRCGSNFSLWNTTTPPSFAASERAALVASLKTR